MGRPSPLSWALAPAVVAAVLVLQTSARLPSPAVQAGVAIGALGLFGAAVSLRRRVPRLVPWLVLCALTATVWTASAWRATERLEDRLPAALEGRWLVVRGVVDELPVALPHGQGWRFGFSIERCESIAAEPRGARARGGARATDAGSTASEAASMTGEAAGESSGPDGQAAGEVPHAECRLPSRLSLSWSGGGRRASPSPPEALRPAQRWTLTVRLRRPHAQINFGAFDRELRWLEEGIGAVGTVRDGRLLDERVASPGALVERLRDRARDALYAAAGADRAREAGLLAALAVGDQAAIAPVS